MERTALQVGIAVGVATLAGFGFQALRFAVNAVRSARERRRERDRLEWCEAKREDMRGRSGSLKVKPGRENWARWGAANGYFRVEEAGAGLFIRDT